MEENKANTVEIQVVKVDDVVLENGRSFKAYKVVDKDGKFMDCKFRKDCKNIPTEPCIIVVDEEMANVDNTSRYPVLWVKDVIECKPFIRQSNLRNWF